MADHQRDATSRERILRVIEHWVFDSSAAIGPRQQLVGYNLDLLADRIVEALQSETSAPVDRNAMTLANLVLELAEAVDNAAADIVGSRPQLDILQEAVQVAVQIKDQTPKRGRELPAVNSASRPASEGVCFSETGRPVSSSSCIRDSAQQPAPAEVPAGPAPVSAIQGTPRTDAKAFKIHWSVQRGMYTVSIPNFDGGEVVLADDARQLERELAALTAGRKCLQATEDGVYCDEARIAREAQRSATAPTEQEIDAAIKKACGGWKQGPAYDFEDVHAVVEALFEQRRASPDRTGAPE